MRHGRLVVYCGAMGALAVMHILSVLMGFALPSLLPKQYTHAASIVLFLYFGFRLLKDAYDIEYVIANYPGGLQALLIEFKKDIEQHSETESEKAAD